MGLNNLYEPMYKALVQEILDEGTMQPVRDNNWAISAFGKSLTFNCNTGLFPILTSKKMYFKNIKHELAWILKGLTNVKYLNTNDVRIWDMWADINGEIGDTYGKQLRSFNGIDQFKTTIDELKRFKHSRQLVISLWNPVAISQGNLKPCYHSFQYVVIGDRLNIIVSQRSADVFVGLPYDMGTFSLLLYLTARHVGLSPGEVKINIGNAHIYKEHLIPVEKYLEKRMHKLPRLHNENDWDLINFDVRVVYLTGYMSEGFIEAKIIK